MNCLMWVENWDGKLPMPAILKPEPLWTGKQLFSMILPLVNVERFSQTHPDDERDVIMSPGDTRISIVRGELLMGILDKPSLGVAVGSLIHVIWLEHGPEAAKLFMSQIQTLVNYWLMQSGFTVHIGDCVPSEHVMMKTRERMSAATAKVNTQIAEARSGQMEREPGHSYISTFEVRVCSKVPLVMI